MLPTVVFDIRSADGTTLSAVRVSMDGAVVASKLDGSAIAVDPGKHAFTFDADGFAPVAESLVVLEGEKARIERLVLQPRAASAQASPSSAGAGSTIPPAATFAALGAGVAGVAVGAIFGALALGNKKSLDDHCPSGTCPASEQGDIEGLHTNAVGSNIGFAIGIVGLAAATVLFLVAHPTARHAIEAKGESGGARPTLIGLGGAGLEGTFQ